MYQSELYKSACVVVYILSNARMSTDIETRKIPKLRPYTISEWWAHFATERVGLIEVDVNWILNDYAVYEDVGSSVVRCKIPLERGVKIVFDSIKAFNFPILAVDLMATDPGGESHLLEYVTTEIIIGRKAITVTLSRG